MLIDGIAAVLVIRRRRDDAWVVDVCRFVEIDGEWRDLGSGGGTWGDLPLEAHGEGVPELGPVTSGWSAGEDDESVATAGGFVIGPVAFVEASCGEQVRRIQLPPGSAAFVVTLKVPDDDLDRMDIRALDAAGSVVDSTAQWEAEREASQPGVTVAEALESPDGSIVTVRGTLLALPGHDPLIL